MYHEIVLNSLAYLGFSSMREIEKMTLNEYLIRMEAFQLQTIKRNEEIAYQAWLNQQVQATTGSPKNPKPKFKEFRKFFDSEKMIDEVRSSFEIDYITTLDKAKNKGRKGRILMAQSFSVKAILEAVDQSFSSTIERAGQSVQSFGSSTTKRLAGVGKAMTVAGAATTAMGIKSVKSFGNFQQSLNQAAVIAGGTSKDISGLADVANRMGAELPLSA